MFGVILLVYKLNSIVVNLIDMLKYPNVQYR